MIPGFKVLSGIAIILIIACSPAQNKATQSSQKYPSWIDSPAKLYPTDVYLTGVGSGDTSKNAENDAYASLAKIFSVEIKVNQSTLENYLEQEVDGQNKSTFSSLLLGKTSAKSHQELKNIKIDRTFFSEQKGIYYAIAVLNRFETATLYKSEINRNNQKTEEYYAQFKQSQHKLQRLKFLNKSISLNRMNALLGEQYRIISGMETIQPPIAESALKAQQLDLLDQIVFSVKSDQQESEEITAYLKETLSDMGFKAQDGPTDFIIKYSFTSEHTDISRASTYALNWYLKIDMQDVKDNRELKTFTVNKRTTALNEQAAQARMMRVLKKVITIDFHKQLINYFNSM